MGSPDQFAKCFRTTTHPEVAAKPGRHRDHERRVCRQRETALWFVCYRLYRRWHPSIASRSTEVRAASLWGCCRTSYLLLTAVTGLVSLGARTAPYIRLNLNCIFRLRIFRSFYESKFDTSHSCMSKSVAWITSVIWLSYRDSNFTQPAAIFGG